VTHWQERHRPPSLSSGVNRDANIVQNQMELRRTAFDERPVRCGLYKAVQLEDTVAPTNQYARQRWQVVRVFGVNRRHSTQVVSCCSRVVRGESNRFFNKCKRLMWSISNLGHQVPETLQGNHMHCDEKGS